MYTEMPTQTDQFGSVSVQDVPIETSVAASDCAVAEHGNSKVPLKDVSKGTSNELLEPPSADGTASSSLQQFETPAKSSVKNFSSLGHRDKRTSKARSKKYMSRSLENSERVLRSRTRETPKSLEPSNKPSNVENESENKRKKTEKRRGNTIIADEFLRIRKHLRYFLNRIGYEQSLINAYSSEGWKGNSLEKLKPEKELQRATSEILRRQLKIRDLFQQLDSLCAQGSFPETLFDSEGQIDSEDIFCAKCGSKELSANNDIILCDGACDRGFHQFCLEPPLLSEDVPPDDEGWLCPGCDCKVDCIELLNDSQGTNLSINDNWEKVFPEAAAARDGKDQDLNLGLPSDDSDDDDYDPDGPETNEKVKEDDSCSDESSESGSDESDYASACDELEDPPNDEQNIRLPSDDSEDDDDFDPNASDIDEDVKPESSSSDFTSDSEDLAFAIDADNNDNDIAVSGKQSSKRGRKKSSLKGELVDILEPGSGQDGSPPVSGKRHVERLDYKKLHDEEYGHTSSESSDDEDWTDNTARRRRNKSAAQIAIENTPIDNNDTTMEAINQDVEDDKQLPRRTTRQKSVKSANKSQTLEGSPQSGSTDKRVGSTHRRLGEAATQRLFSSFKQNQYPDRGTKESLAQELGITSQKVSKWFENARWSARHSSPIVTSESASKMSPFPRTRKAPLESEQELNIKNSSSNGVKEESSKKGDMTPELGSGAVGKESSSRKRKGRSDPHVVEIPDYDSPAVQETETGVRTRTRRRNSVA
ncbi:hypothetical protein UlMin_031076 [Ulmus minor]